MRHTSHISLFVLIAVTTSAAAASSEAPCSSFDGHWILDGAATSSNQPAHDLDIQAGNIKRSDGTTSSMKACLLKDDGYALVQDDTDHPLLMHVSASDIVETNDLDGHPLKYLRAPQSPR